MKNSYWLLVTFISFAAVCVFTNTMPNGEKVRCQEAEKVKDIVTLLEKKKIQHLCGFLFLKKTLSSTKETIVWATSWLIRFQSKVLSKQDNITSWPRLALVIDDFGYNYGIAERIAHLKLCTTWAIIPRTPHSFRIAEYAVKQGQSFLLHVPMQAIGDPNGSRNYVIGIDVPEKKIIEYLSSLQRDFPHAIGINNHRGSKATSDVLTMRRFMKALSATQWGFLDSHTSGKSVAKKVALEYRIPVVQNKIFIDGTTDLSMMKAQFNIALRLAKKYGKAVAICHARERTLPFLAYLSKLDLSPVELVSVDRIWNSQHSVKGEKK